MTLKRLCILSLCLVTIQGYSQSKSELKIGFPLVDGTPNFEEIVIELDALDVKELDVTELYYYYFVKSSVHLYDNRDSSTYFLEKAFEYNPKRICLILSIYDQSYKERIDKGYLPPDFTWYLWDLPDFNDSLFLENCKEYHTLKKREKNTRIKSILEDRLYKNDQEGRLKNIKWELQDKLDQKNRDVIDSVYTVRGRLTAFNEYELCEFTRVLHHSNDYDWVYKWFEIWLKELSKYEELEPGGLLGVAVQRFFGDQGQFCFKEDPERAKKFLTEMKAKYPVGWERTGFKLIKNLD